MSSSRFNSRRTSPFGEDENALRNRFEMYQAFMAGYVRRINQASFKVAIGGVRIGQAKYSRLAQINLRSRIITFSRYAIENVPERGRRYLVLHELAHIKEASHNNRFWNYVGQYEPDYKQIGRKLETAFKRNVNSSERGLNNPGLLAPYFGETEKLKELVASPPLFSSDTARSASLITDQSNTSRSLPAPSTDSAPIVTALDDEEIWREIQEEYTYWRDDSDEDSDVEISATEYDGVAPAWDD